MWRQIPGNLSAFERLQDSLHNSPSLAKPIAMVGAGASAGPYPLWSELIRDLANETVSRGLAREDDRDYWVRIATSLPQQAMRCIEDRWGRATLQRELERIFAPKRDRSFTVVHDFLIGLPVRGYVTTNYDAGLTEAQRARNPGSRETRGTWKDDSFVNSWLTGEVFWASRPILHAHGTYERPDTIVLSQADYREAYGATQWRRLLEKLWGQDTLLFVGFGFTDRWLTYVAETVLTPTQSSHTPRHFALVGLSNDDAYVPDMRRYYHDAYAIEPIFYPVSTSKRGRESWEDHSALLDILEALGSAPSQPLVSARLEWPAQFDNAADRFVRPLHLAENRFLQVLLSRFSLSRIDAPTGRGAALIVSFDHQTPAIWTRHAKAYLKDSIPDFGETARTFQSQLERFLIDGEGDELPLDLEQKSFVFRYASAGTLPILRMGGRKYYCLFYRDVDPIGWNIANGGCDTLEELCNPIEAMTRELREELIVLDAKTWYYFAKSDLQSRPEFAIAETNWSNRLLGTGRRALTELEPAPLGLATIDGPDELLVRFGATKERRIPDVFLNINALDFGIEIDKIVEFATNEVAMSVKDSTLVLCDGEVADGRLLNRPVGLFDTDRVDNAMLADRTTPSGEPRAPRPFHPDYFFCDGSLQTGDVSKWILGTFLTRLRHEGIRTAKELDAFEREPNKFVLCPVTAQIITRHVRGRGVAT